MLKLQIKIWFSIGDDLYGGTSMANCELLNDDQDYELEVRCESFQRHENGNSLAACVILIMQPLLYHCSLVKVGM